MGRQKRRKPYEDQSDRRSGPIFGACALHERKTRPIRSRSLPLNVSLGGCAGADSVARRNASECWIESGACKSKLQGARQVRAHGPSRADQNHSRRRLLRNNLLLLPKPQSPRRRSLRRIGIWIRIRNRIQITRSRPILSLRPLRLCSESLRTVAARDEGGGQRTGRPTSMNDHEFVGRAAPCAPHIISELLSPLNPWRWIVIRIRIPTSRPRPRRSYSTRGKKRSFAN